MIRISQEVSDFSVLHEGELVWYEDSIREIYKVFISDGNDEPTFVSMNDPSDAYGMNAYAYEGSAIYRLEV